MAFHQFHLSSPWHYNLCHTHSHEHKQPLCNSHSSHITQSSPSLFPWTSKNFFNNPLKLIISLSTTTTTQPRCSSVSSSSSSAVPLQEDAAAAAVFPEEEEEDPHPDPYSKSPESSSENPNEEIKSSSTKKYIWVNPTSSRVTELHEKSYDARYTFLMHLAESLNSCNPTEVDVSKVLDRLSDKKPVEKDAVNVLNNMKNPATALIALKIFRQKLKTRRRKVILYNVTLKVFRKVRDLDGAEKFFGEMLDRGVKPDQITFSTLISCARLCDRLDKALEWFHMLPQYGYEQPDDVINAAMIDVYGRIGNTKMSLSLYEQARERKWRIDIVTFATVMKIYNTLGNLDGALSVYADIKALRMKPNTTVYNVLLDVLGKSKRPWQVKTVFQEMSDNGLSPNFSTYAALLRAYCKARFVEDALSVYKEMKEKGDFVLNVVLYNTLLAMCADMGCTDNAVEIYQDMKRSGSCVPDNWTFSSLITTYSSSGNVSEVERVLNEMLERGIEPDIFVLTSLVQCYGKANRTDDVLKTFDRVLELGITPDDRFCGCLLNVLNQTPKEEELGKLASCISRANPKLGYVVKLLLGEEASDRGFKEVALELIESIGKGVRKAYCNGLIDLCVKLNLMERASELLELGLTLKIYIGIQSKSPTQWSLNLRSLSLGAALTALHIWMRDLSKVVDNEEELPSLLGIDTGHGKHSYNKGLASEIASHLMELNSPFHEAPDNDGWFLTTKVAAESWLKSRSSHELVTA